MNDRLREVRALLASELAGEIAGRELIDRCTELSRRLPQAEVPHEVWHYLHDADIRVRDRAYAQVQLESMKAVLASNSDEQSTQRRMT